MSNFDNNILKRNIRILMENDGMTQSELSKLTGMSQPNVSKALNESDKKQFTLEQICIIADHFNVSVDALLERKTIELTQSPRDICAFIALLLKSKVIRSTHITVEEETYHQTHDPYGNLCGYSPDRNENGYTAFYFSNYNLIWSPDFHEFEILSDLARQEGNFNDTNAKINLFIKKYLEIFKIYDKGELPQDAYDIVLNNYLSEL